MEYICKYCKKENKQPIPNPYNQNPQYYQKCCYRRIIYVEYKNIKWWLGYFCINIDWLFKVYLRKYLIKKIKIKIAPIFNDIGVWESKKRATPYCVGRTWGYKMYCKLTK